MQGFSVLLGAIAALSLSVTKVVDFFRNAFDKTDSFPKWVWNVLAVVVGVAMCLGWSINIAGSAAGLVPSLAEQADRLAGTAGEILTGAVVGLAAGFWHELLDSLSGIASRTHAEAAQLEETDGTGSEASGTVGAAD